MANFLKNKATLMQWYKNYPNKINLMQQYKNYPWYILC